jgi:hypothetical protein
MSWYITRPKWIPRNLYYTRWFQKLAYKVYIFKMKHGEPEQEE